MQFTLAEQSDWCNNMPLRSYNYAPVLPVNVSRPYFSTRPQGAREKFGVWGRDYGTPETCLQFSDSNTTYFPSSHSYYSPSLLLYKDS